MLNLYSSINRRGTSEEKEKELETTGHDRFCQVRPSRSSFRKKRMRHVRRAQSAAEFDPCSLLAANKRTLFKGRSFISEYGNSESEQTEKSPLVNAKLETFAKMIFSRTTLTNDSSGNSSMKETISSPTRTNLKFQYSALDIGTNTVDGTRRDQTMRENSMAICQQWIERSSGRYEIMGHLEDIGCRPNKNWFLLNDTTIRTDRLMTLVQLPSDCVALEELPRSESAKGVLMELLGSLQHPYIHPVLDLGFFYSNQRQCACLVMPFNSRGSLKDLIYKSQWNEPWNRKYTKKSFCLPLPQVQRLGRQILEALLFLKERGFSAHGHLHSGNVILQNGVARLSGLENGLLGLSSKVNAIVWSKGPIENIDLLCFGHLLFEMCTGSELPTPQPTPGHLQLGLERYPQVVEVLQLIFESPEDHYPTIEDLVVCDFFRNIDLREMRGPSVPSFKHGLSISTMNLLNAVRRRQGASMSGSYSEGSSPCTPPSTPRRIGMRDVASFDGSSDIDDILDEIIISPATTEFQKLYSCLHPSKSSPITFCENTNKSIPSTSSSENDHESSATLSVTPSTFSNQLTTDCFNTSKNSKSRRMEYSMRSMRTCSTSSSCNPSQDSAFGSMTDGELSIASSSLKMSSFQSISSPIDESVEDSSDFSSSKNVSIVISSTSGISIEPPTILVNDKNSIYMTSPAKSVDMSQTFSEKYRVSSFEDMSTKRNVLKNVRKQNFRSLEEERRIDSAFIPIVKPSHNFDANQSCSINNPDKFKKLTHVSFASKVSTRERHTLWNNSILSRGNSMKSNESFHEYLSLDTPSNDIRLTRQEYIYEQNRCKRVNSTSELRSSNLIDSDGRFPNDATSQFARKSYSERHLFNLIALKQSKIHNDCAEDEDNIYSGSSCSSGYSKISLRNSKVDINSKDFSPSHQSMCEIIGGIGKDTCQTEDKIPLLDGMEMSPISPVETDEFL